MKNNNHKIAMLVIASAILMTGVISSCSKKSSGGSPAPVAPTNPGGYDSSAQIQASSLVAYFPFNGSYNDAKSGLVGTNTGGGFATGIKGQGFKGDGSSYITVPFGSSAGLFSGTSMKSCTISFWVLEPQQPIYATNGLYTPGQGPEGVLFMYDAASPAHQDLFHFDIEPNSHDTMRLNAGFTLTGATTTGPYVGSTVGGTEGVVPAAYLDTAINKWTHIVMTYNGAGSVYTLYENGIAVRVNSAWSSVTGTGAAPVTILTGGTTDVGSMPLGVMNFTPSPTGLVIGAWAGNAGVAGQTTSQYTGSLTGTLDELRIYNSALNAIDVQSLYILEKGGF
jgi:hypothetical protein